MSYRRQRLLTQFNRYDSDHDGRISCQEFQAMLSERGYTATEAEKLMAGYDLDHDGYLSFDEFKRFLNFSWGRCNSAVSYFRLGSEDKWTNWYTDSPAYKDITKYLLWGQNLDGWHCSLELLLAEGIHQFLNEAEDAVEFPKGLSAHMAITILQELKLNCIVMNHVCTKAN